MTEIKGLPVGYAEYLDEVKRDVLATQQPARRVLNSAVLILNWRIGCEILQRQELDGRGGSGAERLARDLKPAFPDSKDFSVRSPQYRHAFVQGWVIRRRRAAESTVANYTYKQLLFEERCALSPGAQLLLLWRLLGLSAKNLTGTEAVGE